MSNENKLPYRLDTPHRITLYKNGENPYIYYYFTWKKKSYRGSTGKKDLELSKQEVFDIFYEIKTGRKLERSIGSSKFSDVCKIYLKDRKKILSPRTYIQYKRYIDILKIFFRDSKIDTLCSQKVYTDYKKWRDNHFEEYKSKIKEIHNRNGNNIDEKRMKCVGSVSINRELRLFVGILRYSKNFLGLLNDKTIPPCNSLFLKENSGKRILTDEEFEKLRDYMSVNRPYQWLIISFINSTGIRYPSEISRITWGDLEWETPCVWIRNRKNPKIGTSIDTPFPLVGTSFDVIKTLWSRENNKIRKGSNDRVFVNDNGKPGIDIRRCFKNSLKICGIENDVCLYSFRHRFTTRMIMNNTIPPLMLSKFLGHTSMKMVMSHYQMLDKYDYVKSLQNNRVEYYKNKQDKQNHRPENHTTEPPSLSDEPPSYLDLYSQSDT